MRRLVRSRTFLRHVYATAADSYQQVGFRAEAFLRNGVETAAQHGCQLLSVTLAKFTLWNGRDRGVDFAQRPHASPYCRVQLRADLFSCHSRGRRLRTGKRRSQGSRLHWSPPRRLVVTTLFLMSLGGRCCRCQSHHLLF